MNINRSNGSVIKTNNLMATHSPDQLAKSDLERALPCSVNKLTLYWGNNLMRAEEVLWDLDENMNDFARTMAEDDVAFLLDIIDLIA